MAESKLNFDAPLLSTRKMEKTSISVRRNIPKKLTDDYIKTSESLSGSVLVQDLCDDDDDDDDDVFTDALDTLSLKHSVSSVVEAMPSEDSQPRDYMMNRFLPAAKSMTVEQQQQQTQYGLKPMRHIRDIVPVENRATPKRYESCIITPSYYRHGIDGEESEEDSSDDDDDEASEYLSKRGCGMMSPQICFKNSLGMLSSVRTSSHHDQVKLSKVAQLKSRFQSVKQLALDSIYKQKLGSVGKKFNLGSEQVLESKMSTSASRPSSPYRQSGCMSSPYRSVGNSSPLHPAGFPGTRKEAEIMRANRLNKHIRNIQGKSQELLYPKSTRQVCSTSSLMEKTLYVDTQKVKNLPETVETVSEEPEMAGKKPKAIVKLQAVETLSVSSGCDLTPPLAPPPPKKPSDSWLFRNRSSVSSKFPSKKDLEENSTSVITKWETIVKTSYKHRDHIRYSEELVARSSCQSKT